MNTTPTENVIYGNVATKIFTGYADVINVENNITKIEKFVSISGHNISFSYIYSICSPPAFIHKIFITVNGEHSDILHPTIAIDASRANVFLQVACNKLDITISDFKQLELFFLEFIRQVNHCLRTTFEDKLTRSAYEWGQNWTMHRMDDIFKDIDKRSSNKFAINWLTHFPNAISTQIKEAGFDETFSTINSLQPHFIDVLVKNAEGGRCALIRELLSRHDNESVEELLLDMIEQVKISTLKAAN